MIVCRRLDEGLFSMQRRQLGLTISFLLSVSSYAQEATEVIEVVGQTPLAAGIDADQIASNVQLATAAVIRETRALDLADFMKRNLASVFVNEAQSNPLQPDVQYRGFVGSPLLGLPQGIAVYQDGVRINEPFGDTVNWAVIPESAIERVYLIPGSNPLFGLNALGGAISVETKTGFSSPGTRAELFGGSFGRVGVQAETGGGTNDRFSYFLTGAYLEEDGWRDYSPTESIQVFGNLGWQSAATSIDLNLTLADTDLVGNGAAPVELLEIDRQAIFTRPDQTQNKLQLFNIIAEHEISDTLGLTGNLYVRNSDIITLNGDDSDFEECEDDPGFVCIEEDGAETLVFDPSGNPVPASDALEGAAVNRSSTLQDGMGFGFQAAWTGGRGERENALVVGLAYDASEIAFDASTELGTLDASRLAIPGGVFVGDSFTRLQADTATAGFYLSGTLTLSDDVALTLSGRYNQTDIVLRDQLGTALNGDHSFDRFNPAISLTARLTSKLVFYTSYSESNRVPSPVELTCADPDDPCRLPNAFLADPPLEQVVAETFEVGIRGESENGRWHAGFFRTTNQNDILFISAGALTNEGFFDNVGKTQRDGIELNIDGQHGDGLTWFASYTFLDASFRESLSFPSANNPAAIDGQVFVEPGDQLPLIPRQLLKGGLRVAIGNKITVGGDILVGSDFHMRGDEGNDLAKIGDYAVINLRGDYRVNERVRIFLDIDNVLNENYVTFGLFGEPGEVLGDGFADSRFLSPAMPRAAWLGFQLDF